MKRSLLVLSTLLFLAQASFSQITNVRRWRNSEKDSLNNALLMYEEGLYLMALPIFENILKAHPNEEFIQYSYAKCAIYRSDKHEDAYKYLSAIYAKNKKVDEIDYDIARSAHYVNKLDEATTAVDKYLAKKRLKPEDKAKALLLKRYINNARIYLASPTNAKVDNLGDAVNTEGEEYVPAITADESTLIYTYSGPKSTGGLVNDLGQPDPLGIYHEDIYMSRKQNGAFNAGVPLTYLNTDANDAAVSLSNDGNTLYMFRDNSDDHGDLYESHLSGQLYSTPMKLKGIVNSYSWDGHCSLSPDGRTLYFSSERGGGYGGKDIYSATLQADSTWGGITNLGDSVNTVYDEDAPFIHPDGVTLYFSSKGRTSMGGYDVFRSTMNPTDSSFKQTESLGVPINSTDDDIYFVVAANNKSAYYSSGRSGGKGLKDIYHIEPNFSNKAALYLVKGKVKLDTGAVAAVITVENTTKSKVYTTLVSNSASGAYLVALPAGAKYKLTYNVSGMAPQTLDVDAQAISDYTEKIYDVTFKQGAGGAVAATPATPAADTAAKTAVIIPKNLPDGKGGNGKEAFVPQNKYQEQLVEDVGKYGDFKDDDLEFHVQIGAFKNADNITYPNLAGMGKIQKLPGDNGLTRVIIGPPFKTIRKAFEYQKKIIAAGQSDAFVMTMYKGKRVSMQELESMGVLNRNK